MASSVLTMEQGALLPHGLPLHGEYSLSSEQDYNDHFSPHAPHAPHASYANVGAVDLRRDGNLPQQATASFAFAPSNHAHEARFVGPERGAASRYHPTNNFTDGSASISTSPSSAASSQAYTNYPTNHYTSIPTFPGPVQHPQAFVTGSYTGTHVLDSSSSGMQMLPPPLRSPISTATHPGDRGAYATPYSASSQLSTHTQPGFGTFQETPRSVLLGAAPPLSPGGLTSYASQMASANGYGSSAGESLNFPWPEPSVLLDITCEGQAVTPMVYAKVEKGFFLSTQDQKWTCYRRNYFSVACHFELHPNINNGRLYVKRNNNQEQIQAMGMRLSAAVDGAGGKSIELIQHTPKRDNGPKNKIDVTKVSPTPSGRGEHTVSPHGIYQVPLSTFHATGAVPGPYLPLQNSDETDRMASSIAAAQVSAQYPYSASAASHLPVPGQHTTHTFERVQFKQATANNGKRRASQQYFHLVVELFADVRKEGSDIPAWVKIAQRLSEKIVVRGRSPSHYQNEGQNGQPGRGGSASGGSGGGGGGYTAATPGYGGMNAGGFRSSTAGYTGGVNSVGGYRTNSFGPNPTSDASGSSPSSVDEGAVDGDHRMKAVMSDADRASIQEYEGYQYYPSTIYEPQQVLPLLGKIESTLGYTAEPRQYAVKAEYADALPGPQWSIGGCGRFQGVDSSHGYFPNLSAGFS